MDLGSWSVTRLESSVQRLSGSLLGPQRGTLFDIGSLARLHGSEDGAKKGG